MTAELREIFMETAEENGWLEDLENSRVIEKAKRIAKKLLMEGYPIEKVAETTELPLEIVTSL
jgi:hypothetical protein